LLGGVAGAYTVTFQNDTDTECSVSTHDDYILTVVRSQIGKVAAGKSLTLDNRSGWCPCVVDITPMGGITKQFWLGYGLWTPKCWNSTVVISGSKAQGITATWQ
jgi:hypothetical protein